MNALDLILILCAVVAAVGGWRLGFIRRFGGWIGVAIGFAIGIAALPSLIAALQLHDDRVIFLTGSAFMVVLVTAGQGLGEAVGSRIRSGFDTSGGRYLDSVGGSVLGVVAVGVITWMLFPLMAGAQGWPAQLARHSSVARALSESLPAPPAQIGELERQLAGGHFPRLFDRVAPAPEIAQPPESVEFPRDVYERVISSVARIESPACGKIQSGSGFVAAPGRIVTNAHVVAGAESTSITTVDGRQSRATVVHFDPRRDLAVLAVDTASPPLPIGSPAAGDTGLVMGFPGGGPFHPSPFSLAQQVRASGYDIYDRTRVERDILVLSSSLQPGDSGSAVLRSDGSVIGVAVAIAPDKPSVAYALASTELRSVLKASGDTAVATGACR